MRAFSIFLKSPWHRMKSTFVKRCSISKTEERLQDFTITIAAEFGKDSSVAQPHKNGEVEPPGSVNIRDTTKVADQPGVGKASTGCPSTICARPTRQRANTEELLYNFGVYSQQLEDAQHQLEIRVRSLQQEHNNRRRKLEAGHQVEMWTGLDAEQEYNDAKAALIATGVQPPGSDIESGFVDDANNGYRISGDHDFTECVDIEHIWSWPAEVPNVELLGDDSFEVGSSNPGEVGSWKFVEV
ncbi:hypothetical protein DOTSEDRAFT_20450 [Dothistroma septosporum NZE10]|uniref:Uncharacterized protein n=1 Tax=Dothistroma septosporum (strain NZE10 / CBS 128990) TaxID=675120 RepID=N1Q300_DOTSN|nr:hypothetical protein DOTSEDRAFT_20450 [Dothistroma septosporum NZE10]